MKNIFIIAATLGLALTTQTALAQDQAQQTRNYTPKELENIVETNRQADRPEMPRFLLDLNRYNVKERQSSGEGELMFQLTKIFPIASLRYEGDDLHASEQRKYVLTFTDDEQACTVKAVNEYVNVFKQAHVLQALKTIDPSYGRPTLFITMHNTSNVSDLRVLSDVRKIEKSAASIEEIYTKWSNLELNLAINRDKKCVYVSGKEVEKKIMLLAEQATEKAEAEKIKGALAARTKAKAESDLANAFKSDGNTAPEHIAHGVPVEERSISSDGR